MREIPAPTAMSAQQARSNPAWSSAFELCLLLVDKAPDRFGRAALRWHGGIASLLAFGERGHNAARRAPTAGSY